MDKPTQLLCDLFAGVPGPDDLIGKAGGRIIEAVINKTGFTSDITGPIASPREWLARYGIAITEAGPTAMANGKAAALFQHPSGPGAVGAKVIIPIGYDIDEPKVAWTVWHEIGHAADYIHVRDGKPYHEPSGHYSALHLGIMQQHSEEIIHYQRFNPENRDYKLKPNELWAECVACAVMEPKRMSAPLLDAILPDLIKRNLPVTAPEKVEVTVGPQHTGNATLAEIIADLGMTKEKIGGYWIVTKGEQVICREGEVDDIWRELINQGFIKKPYPSDEPAAVVEPPFQGKRALTAQGYAAFHDLKHFMSIEQRAIVQDCMAGEERDFFFEKMIELAAIVKSMPKTKETDDGRGGKAIAYLHYFAGGQANFYLTERDVGSSDDPVPGVQHQAFGRADLFGDGGELGYISLPEIFKSRGELDFYWTPKTLDEIEAERRGEEGDAP